MEGDLKMKISRDIAEVNPATSEEECSQIVETLLNYGIDTNQDLTLLTEEDLKLTLTGSLKPLQIRKLITKWNRQDGVDKNEDENKTIESTEMLLLEGNQNSVPDIKTQFNQGENDKPAAVADTDWTVQYTLPLNRMAADLRSSLIANKRLHPKFFRRFVTVVAEDLFEKEARPLKKHIVLVSKKICKTYPCVRDSVCGETLGCGYATLLKKLSCKVENEMRRVNISRRQLVKEKKKYVNQHNTHICCNFWPNAINGDEERMQIEMIERNIRNESYPYDLMKGTYNSQRRDIVSGKNTIMELLAKWPYLFTYDGMVFHYKQLTSSDLQKNLHESLENKMAPFIKYLSSQSACSKIYEEMLIQSGADGDQTSHIIGLVLMVMAMFKEPSQQVVAVPTTGSMNEDWEINLPPTPCLIALGNNLIQTTQYKLSIDSELVTDDAYPANSVEEDFIEFD